MVVAFVASIIFPNMINAAPTISLNVDLYTNGTNPIHNYAKGDYDTGQIIYLQPGEDVWIDFYISIFGDGLANYGARITWDSSQLTASNLIIPYPWADFGFSEIGPGYLNLLAGHFPPGTCAEGGNILLVTFKLTCIGAGTSSVTIYDWPEGGGNWITCQGFDLSRIINGLTLATITNIAPPCKCDLNSDGRCNMSDWLLFGQRWGATNCNTVPCACDLNTDGICNMIDWLLLGQGWGRNDCPRP